MLIAAAAMFLAVAGSAFIIRARMHACPMPHRSRAAVPAVVQPAEVRPSDAVTPARVPCGHAYAYVDHHGTNNYFYEVCPDGEGEHPMVIDLSAMDELELEDLTFEPVPAE